MRVLFALLLSASCIVANAQGKFNTTLYNYLTPIEETPYVVATLYHTSNQADEKQQVVFINTKTGKRKEFTVSDKGFIVDIVQIKVKEHGLNKVIVAAKDLNANAVKRAVARSPLQIFVVADDDKEPIRIVDDNFTISNWVYKKETATIVVTGYYDTDGNGKYDLKDKGEIQIFDLKTMRNATVL